MQSSNSEKPRLRVDLAGASFEEFIAFVFDHPVVPDGHEGEKWYLQHDLEINIDPGHQVQFLTMLFRHPDVLLERYSPAQIDQGFWFMFIQGQEWFMDPLWDRAIPRAAREACVLAIPELYRRLFEREPIGLAPWMLWDLLADGFVGYAGRPPERAGEDDHVRAAMFQACRIMLASPSPETQRAALHGLFHLEHPRGPAMIRAWLDSTSGLSDRTRAYAEDVLAGKAL